MLKRIKPVISAAAVNRSNQQTPLLAGTLMALTLFAIHTNVFAGTAPPHNISAMNLNVIQNDTGNTVDSVTVNANLSINDMRVRVGSNRGDYNLQIGDTGTNDLVDGM